MIAPGNEYPKADNPADDEENHDVETKEDVGRKEVVGTGAPARSGGAKRRTTFDQHRVIGSEAKRTQHWEDLEGVVVDVEITDWPTPMQQPKGRVTEILGYEDDFGVDVEIIIRKHHLPHRFPAEVLEQAANLRANHFSQRPERPP